MGKLSGTVLILSGVSIAAYALLPQQDAATTVVAAENAAPARPAPMTPAAPAPKPVAESPAPAMASPPPKMPSSTRTEPAPATSPPPASLAPPAGPQKLRPGMPPPVRVAEAPPRLPVGESAATASPPLDRPALTREIQRQLKRIGCYQGEISGVWSLSVRQAAKTMTDRVNATLPTEQPDPVLLAMVQGQEPGTCAASCPQGQSRAADGRCLPGAIVASADKQRASGRAQAGQAVARQTTARQAQGQPEKTTGKTTGRAAPPAAAAAAQTEAVAPPPPSVPDGRMSLAGPGVDVARQAKARPPQRSRQAATPQRAAAAYYRAPNPRYRQRSAQRSGSSFWPFPFFMP